MINDFLIINFTGKNDLFGLRTNNNFFTQKFQTNSKNNNETLVSKISDFLSKHSVKIDKNFSIIVNNGPGSFSSLRVSLSVAKGIEIASNAKLFGFKDIDLPQFNLDNIEFLIKKKLVEKNLIKLLYLS